MRIAQIITRSDTLGGASAHVRDLSIALIKRGHQVCVIVGGDGPIVKLLKDADIPVKSINNLVRELSLVKDVKAYYEIKRLIAEYSPDIVACHSAKAGLLGRLVAKNLQLPTIYTAHGWPFTEGVPKFRGIIYRYIERLMAKYTNRIITVSNYDKALAVKYKVTSDTKSIVIWNGIPDIKRHECGELHVREDKPKILNILMVARFERPKKFEMLLHALSLISNLQWTASFVGDGPELENVKKVCSGLNLTERVDFLGWRSDVVQLLSNADIFALISDWEGLPLSILEAMRQNLPVVATNVGGVSEAVIESYTGNLVPVDDVNLLSEALKTLLLDYDSRKSMGSQGRQRYEELFTVDKMCAKTIKVYEEAISDSKNQATNQI